MTDVAETLKRDTLIAVALLPDGSVVVRSCVTPAETAVWLLEVAESLLEQAEADD